MLRLQPLSSPLTTTQNPRLHHSPLLFLQLSTKRTAFNSNISSKRLSVYCRSSEHFEQQRFATAPTPSNSFASQAPGAGALPPRFFVGHSIYKGKAALTVEPRAPDFTPLDSGAFKLSKEGFVLLQFAPAAGVRQYDWNRKQVFSLSVTEIGNLVSLGARDSCEFFHDPFKGKRLFLIYYQNEGVQNKLLNVDESIYIPITRAEYTVLISAFNDGLVAYPHDLQGSMWQQCIETLSQILGKRRTLKSTCWHAFANSIKPDDTSRVNSANSRYGGDFEWSR
ncbi:Single-stranded DNA-binding protein WHY1, chloroplastic [Morella rubra]|uniref:Single-stranded DNA-binding protein WHY1, chloroplastic n=1 Tax=Morella rubra TaxID=262757 RepID=A0A6A1V5E4_9ROSI|nr:Single-stranded DNA-binding protein WHY1, chloroplastic [Morella rubra]